jgi:predicted RNase H-like nuclease
VTTVFGVDGCKGGWIAASRAEFGGVKVSVISNVRDLINSNATVIAIDIPVGLSDGKPRQCDLAARRLLGKGRGSSVFPAPFRDVVRVRGWAEANAFSKGKYGKGISKQVGEILSKICEVDDFFPLPDHVTLIEVHPEVCFWKLGGERPMTERKKTRAGREQREAALREHGLELRGVWPPSGASRDDALDAVAALWTAERFTRSEAVRLPDLEFKSADGRPMNIWF